MKYSLSRIEFLGLETFFQNIINAYEISLGIYGTSTKSTDITRRINGGLEIFDGNYDVYELGEMAITSIRCYNGRYYFYGFILRGRTVDEIDFDHEFEFKVDITDFADDYDVDINKLLRKIQKAVDKAWRQ